MLIEILQLCRVFNCPQAAPIGPVVAAYPQPYYVYVTNVGLAGPLGPSKAGSSPRRFNHTR